ncbi:hypothetical protein [Gluconobacter roseus]|uniref:Uncharacterized protein n=1 Tax=Gluconobacter roseus NBRC 3990 TaxID=1307950 RepID=A0A4Y3M5Q6_9PROT|nr:hypothetical protein [Gluconobacter roseus]KXV43072.1 hypothetical protein AD943_08780 [Gluconobacter roseus]GBR43333.1 hypothetical protein AA3990_0391 [Gluconobacter roseus NBRC 3990]GEB03924.1 hypothetical protein GRO01_15000 [Gluconobacter roseus NBRC 3990]GLP94377.1 hypothetical protein GCM10007871_23550 [Gluconobacter roseus NBRC 3990]
MRYDEANDEDGVGSEIQELASELQSDAERLNIATDKSDVPDEIKHMVAALADKIDGLASLLR